MADEHDRVVFQEMLKPYRTAVIAAIPIIGTLGTYGYDVVTFMNRDAAHEKQQDENLLTLRKQLKEQDAQVQKVRERNLELVRLILNDMELIRANQMKVLPKRDREQASRDYAVQRQKGVDLLVEVQKDS